jgi:hypothetical protein
MLTKTRRPKPSRARAKQGGGPVKHVRDVLGISRARVPAHVPRATRDRGGNPKGIEVRSPRSPRPARVVGGVRSHRH